MKDFADNKEYDYDEQLEFQLGDNDQTFASLLYSTLTHQWSVWWISPDGEEITNIVLDLEQLDNFSFCTIKLTKEQLNNYISIKNEFLNKEVPNNGKAN